MLALSMTTMDQTDTVLLQLFTEHSRPLLYGRGDTIIRAGDTPSGIYFITRGWVHVYSLCDDGEPNIIMSLGIADVFPLTWALSDDLREVSFEALEITEVLRMSKEQFSRSLYAHPQIARAASLKLTHYFSRLSNELEHLHYHSARERVAFRLISLAEYFGRTQSNQITLDLRVPNEFIARSSNMTRETASREISWMIKKGFVERQNGYIIIKNLDALRNEADKSPPLPPG